MNLEGNAREPRIPSPELPGSGSMGLSRSHAALSAFVPPGPVGSPSDSPTTVGLPVWPVKRPNADVFEEKTGVCGERPYGTHGPGSGANLCGIPPYPRLWRLLPGSLFFGRHR